MSATAFRPIPQNSKESPMQRRIASFVAVALLLVATPTFADDQITGNSIRMNGRSSAVPSTAGYGSFWYDITTHKFMRSENGGAASDFSAGLNSGVTTCVSGAVGRLLYTAAGLAVKCDATSPQWDPATGTMGISGSAPFLKLGATNSGIGADADGFVQIYGGGVFLDGQSLPAADIGFIDVVPPNEDMQFDVTVYGAAATDPDDRTTAVIVTNGGPLRIFAGGYDGSFESWKYGVDGSLSSVGAGRNLTASGKVGSQSNGNQGTTVTTATYAGVDYADLPYNEGLGLDYDFTNHRAEVRGYGDPGGLKIASEHAIYLYSGGENDRWYIDSANPGNFLAATDGGPDIGASGANRPNNGYFKTDVVINGASVVTSLAGKAADSLVAHLAGTESLTGQKTFSLLPNLPTQSANVVYAGPSSGGSAVPTFRALASADIPNNAANTTGSAASLSGRFVASGTALSGSNISGCGSGASITGVDGAFRLTAGTLTVGLSGCTVTFANGAFAHAPVCHATEETTLAIVRASPTTTTVVLNGTSALTGDAVGVTCTGF